MLVSLSGCASLNTLGYLSDNYIIVSTVNKHWKSVDRFDRKNDLVGTFSTQRI